jgi:hypothetical protein
LESSSNSMFKNPNVGQVWNTTFILQGDVPVHRILLTGKRPYWWESLWRTTSVITPYLKETVSFLVVTLKYIWINWKPRGSNQDGFFSKTLDFMLLLIMRDLAFSSKIMSKNKFWSGRQYRGRRRWIGH